MDQDIAWVRSTNPEEALKIRAKKIFMDSEVLSQGLLPKANCRKMTKPKNKLSKSLHKVLTKSNHVKSIGVDAHYAYFLVENKFTIQQVRTGYKQYKQYNFKILSTTRVLRRLWTSCSGSFVAYSVAYRIERFLGKGNSDSHQRPGLESTCTVLIG